MTVPPIRSANTAIGAARALASTVVGLVLLAAVPAAAQTPPAPPAVTVSKPLQREIVEYDEFTGQFAAVEYVELRARVSGYLQSIHFEDGQIVNKGDLLFVFDPRPYEIALASARAQLDEASARLDLANRQLTRAGRLRKQDFVAASTYDERAQEAASSTAAVEAARAAIRQAELDLEFTRITAPGVGPVPSNTSARCIVIFTGRPHFLLSRAATGSR